MCAWASFVLAVLLLAGAVDANKDWLIALSAITGVAAFMPGLISLDGNVDRPSRRWRAGRWRARRRYRSWDQSPREVDWEGTWQ